MRRGRTARRSNRKYRSNIRSLRTKAQGGGKVKGKKKKSKSKGKKGMNAFMKAKEKARKSGAETFTYNGTTYKQAKTKTGMVIYKKA